jgi:hypothetical protein
VNNEERFWSRVDRSGGPDACWPWLGHRMRSGHGQVGFRRRVWLTHRVAYTLARAEIAAGMAICHSCDNPPCCNPAHLFEGTRADNNADKMAKGRHVTPAGLWNGSSLHPESRPRGEGHARSVLTDDVVRRLRAANASAGDLAVEFGLARSTVRDVVSGRTWRHVA